MLAPDVLKPGDVVVLEAKIMRWKTGETSGLDKDEWKTWKCVLDIVSISIALHGPDHYVDSSNDGALIV